MSVAVALSRGRGSKQHGRRRHRHVEGRPLTRARIETRLPTTSPCGTIVALSRGRGSKRHAQRDRTETAGSPSHEGADRNYVFPGTPSDTQRRPLTRARIETSRRSGRARPAGVALSRGRGSKRRTAGGRAHDAQVALSRGRGSKHRRQPRPAHHHRRPLTRARIETATRTRLAASWAVALSRGRGSKYAGNSFHSRPSRSPSHEGADRNILSCTAPIRTSTSPSHEGAD